MTTTPPESLFNRLEPLLAQVTKPIQYVGGELNAVTKDWVGTDVHWALMYPDAYEVGQPNQGQAIPTRYSTRSTGCWLNVSSRSGPTLSSGCVRWGCRC